MPLYLDPASLDWSLKHIELLGDTDIFPLPFEFEAIRLFWTKLPLGGPKQRVEMRDWLAASDLLSWKWRTPRRCLSPKHQFGFRASTQLDPLDSLIYTGLLYEIGFEIEACRVPLEKKVVHSYRFAPDADGRMFDSNFNFESFRAQSLELAKVNTGGWVVSADIADFYPRIYSHPLDNALAEATAKKDHVCAVKKLISSLNYTVSYGIPVGPAASRLLAEIAIADVDAALMSEGYKHLRFVDDFLIYCENERDAFSALAFLAHTLFENHGLTLQQHKTFIQTTDSFLIANARSESEKERRSLSQRFADILNDLGISSWYEEIDYDDLSEDVQAEVDALNLTEILEEQVASPDPIDVAIVRFVLRRLAQLDDADATDLVLDNMRRFYPLFKDALGYLTAMRSMYPQDKHTVGKRLLDLIEGEMIGHLDFHRAWILSTFTANADWDNEDRFTPFYNAYADSLTRRETILALGRANKAEWFKGRKRDFGTFDIWQRRAFLAAASCLPGDEAKHWYRSIAPQLDELEKAVVDWAMRNPFG